MALVEDIRTAMMEAIGERTFASIPAERQAVLLTKLNATCQKIYGLSPGSWWNEGPAGDLLLAPVTLSSMTVTQGSRDFSGSGLTSRMNGCTVMVSGQAMQNRIFEVGSGTWKFLVPHEGSTVANATITVYHDCLNLTDTAITITRPVMMAGRWELLPVKTAAELQLPGYFISTHNSRPSGSGYPVSGWDRQAATPQFYYVDGAQLYGGSYVTQIRVNPMPDVQYPITWFQRDKFTRITSWSDTRTTIIPHDYHDSVLIPLLKASLMQLPGFQGSKDDAVEDAAEAMRMLAELSRPQELMDVYVEVGDNW